MMLSTWMPRCLALLAVIMISPATASAITLDVIGLGLDVGNACLSTASSCSAEAQFTLPALAPVTGQFDYTPGGGGGGTMAFELDIADFSMQGGGPDGVAELLFSSIHLSVLSWNTFEVGSVIQGLGAASLTLTGSVEQLDGGGFNVAGPTALNEILLATNLGCPVSGVGQCAFSLAARDFQLSVGTANAALHDVTWTFNLQVPEPSTALLVAVGLCLTGLRSRTRRER